MTKVGQSTLHNPELEITNMPKFPANPLDYLSSAYQYNFLTHLEMSSAIHLFSGESQRAITKQKGKFLN